MVKKLLERQIVTSSRHDGVRFSFHVYNNLDDGQKRRFAMLDRLLAPRQGGFDFRGREGDGRNGDGPRRLELGPRRTDFTPQGGEQSL